MYLAFDVETGGLGEDVSLLTCYFGVFNKYLELIDELDLKLKPDDDIYKVKADALAINKIDITELGKVAIYYKEAKPILYKFLQWNQIEAGETLVPVGQNVNFDIRFIEGTLISRGSWENFVSRRPLDTMYIANYLKVLGKIPADQSISLENLVKYFAIELEEGNLHEAKYDTLATIEVFKRLVELGQ